MPNRKTCIFLENFLPITLSSIVLGILAYINMDILDGEYYFSSISLGKNYKDLLISILTIVTIFIALLITVETLIISLPNHETIERLKNNIKSFKAFIGQLFILTLFNIILVLLCLGFIMYDVQTIKFNIVGICFLFSIIYSFIAFLWIEFLFFLIIRQP